MLFLVLLLKPGIADAEILAESRLSLPSSIALTSSRVYLSWRRKTLRRSAVSLTAIRRSRQR